MRSRQKEINLVISGYPYPKETREAQYITGGCFEIILPKGNAVQSLEVTSGLLKLPGFLSASSKNKQAVQFILAR